MGYHNIVIGLVAGFLFGYLSSYFKEKGKNKALLTDIRKLTDEKEKITTEYQLDIAKRKYRYESKQEQFFKFFSLLDEFNAEGNKKLYDEFLPIINKYTKEYVEAYGNKRKELQIVTWFSSATQKIIATANDNHRQFKNETNTIRIIASNELLILLDKLDVLYDLAFEKTSRMLKEMGQLILVNDQIGLNNLKMESEAAGDLIVEMQKQLRERVRFELNEI